MCVCKSLKTSGYKESLGGKQQGKKWNRVFTRLVCTEGRTDPGFGGSNKLKIRPGTKPGISSLSCSVVSDLGACWNLVVAERLSDNSVVPSVKLPSSQRHPKEKKQQQQKAVVCCNIYY